VKKVNNKEAKKQRLFSTEQKKSYKEKNVYDRLYESRRNVKWFNATQSKVKKSANRRPTPVAHSSKTSSIEPLRQNYLSMSAKERINLYDIEPKVSNFVSENPSVRSQFSDKVESHPLTEIDDYDVDENLSNIVLSIKKQNVDLVNKIKSKRPESWGVINSTHWVRGLPLQEFHSPNIAKTIKVDQLSPNQVQLTVIRSRNFESSKADSEVDFERDEEEVNLTKSEKENYSEKAEDKEHFVLQNCLRLLSTKLKHANREIELLKTSRKEDQQNFQKSFDECEKCILKLKTK
jgi:hypothetical protein